MGRSWFVKSKVIWYFPEFSVIFGWNFEYFLTKKRKQDFAFGGNKEGPGLKNWPTVGARPVAQASGVGRVRTRPMLWRGVAWPGTTRGSDEARSAARPRTGMAWPVWFSFFLTSFSENLAVERIWLWGESEYYYDYVWSKIKLFIRLRI